MPSPHCLAGIVLTSLLEAEDSYKRITYPLDNLPTMGFYRRGKALKGTSHNLLDFLWFQTLAELGGADDIQEHHTYQATFSAGRLVPWKDGDAHPYGAGSYILASSSSCTDPDGIR